jgi:hypothetical protein
MIGCYLSLLSGRVSTSEFELQRGMERKGGQKW